MLLARHVVTRLIDDLDGSPAVTTLSFSLDGISYEIDLSKEHHVALQRALAPFVTAARKATGTRDTPDATAPLPKESVRTKIPRSNGRAPSGHDPGVKEEMDTAPPAAVTVVSPAFQKPERNRGRADDSGDPVRPKPRRAPLVADPFNPAAHRAGS
jgi:hypothetical protein